MSDGPSPNGPGDGTVVLGQAFGPAFLVLQHEEGACALSRAGRLPSARRQGARSRVAAPSPRVPRAPARSLNRRSQTQAWERAPEP